MTNIIPKILGLGKEALKSNAILAILEAAACRTTVFEVKWEVSDYE